MPLASHVPDGMRPKRKADTLVLHKFVTACWIHLVKNVTCGFLTLVGIRLEQCCGLLIRQFGSEWAYNVCTCFAIWFSLTELQYKWPTGHLPSSLIGVFHSQCVFQSWWSIIYLTELCLAWLFRLFQPFPMWIFRDSVPQILLYPHIWWHLHRQNRPKTIMTDVRT